MKQIRIGCYSAFWGDSAWAVKQFLESADVKLDYLVADYLAELTMGLLARTVSAASKSSSAKKGPRNGGYIAEFLDMVLKPSLDMIVQKRIKIVANAGGLDPVGLKNAIDQHVQERGLGDKVKVAAVSGDNLMPDKDRLLKDGSFKAFDALSGAGSAEANVSGQQRLLSLNAYLGAEPIAEALRQGATIVVTGRCVDSAVIVGPLAYECGWKFDNNSKDLDSIASASLAGHIIECGAQATGGNYTDWRASAFSANGGWANMGYPILNYNHDDSFTITKPTKTGGIVNTKSVCEQMLYEVLDPENYALPDVVLDMSQVKLEQVDEAAVLVQGARGKPPTPFLKCTAVEQKGFRTSTDYVVCGEDAENKARALGQAVIDRTNALANLKLSSKTSPITRQNTEITVIGAEHSLQPDKVASQSREVVVRIAVKHEDRAVLDIFSKEAAPFLTNSCPGLFMLNSGRPRSSPNFEVTSTLVRRSTVMPLLHLVGEPQKVCFSSEHCEVIKPAASRLQIDRAKVPPRSDKSEGLPAKLHDIAIGRSGDKGDVANIAIIARKPDFYPYILEQVTPAVIFNAFSQYIAPGGTVTRFEVPGVHAVNFVLTKSLGGGGMSSLRLDRQAKSYAQIALSAVQVHVPPQIGISAQL